MKASARPPASRRAPSCGRPSRGCGTRRENLRSGARIAARRRRGPSARSVIGAAAGQAGESGGGGGSWLSAVEAAGRPVAVVRRAGTFGRHHRGTERTLRRAAVPNAGHSRRACGPGGPGRQCTRLGSSRSHARRRTGPRRRAAVLGTKASPLGESRRSLATSGAASKTSWICASAARLPARTHARGTGSRPPASPASSCLTQTRTPCRMSTARSR